MGILSDGETDKVGWCSWLGLPAGVVWGHDLDFQQIQGGQQIGILDLTCSKRDLVVG
jgi:hypothetical protein